MYDSNDYLAHHGILGQKWGVRRYQNYDGTLTEEGRKRAGLKPISKKEERKAKIAKRKADKKAAKDLADKENFKNYLRKHPRQLYKHASELTREEAEEIIKNIEFDRKLKDIRDSETQRTWKKISNIQSNAQVLASLLNTGKSLYNSAAEINNLLIYKGKSNGSEMIKIGEKPPEKKEDRKDVEKIVRSGSAKDVLDNVGKMTPKELEDAMKRLNYEDKLKEKSK